MHRLRVASIAYLYVEFIFILAFHPYLLSADVSEPLGKFLASFFSVPLSLKLVTRDWRPNNPSY